MVNLIASMQKYVNPNQKENHGRLKRRSFKRQKGRGTIKEIMVSMDLIIYYLVFKI